MATVAVRYDGRSVPVTLPDENLITSSHGPGEDVQDTVSELDLRALEERISGETRLLVVVNDGFRSTPTRTMLELVTDLLARAAETRTVVATGVHPPPGPGDLDLLLGDFGRTHRPELHDADRACSDFGRLSDGSRLELNSRIAWADQILLLGSVEPHFFAGFTGGAKQLLPGLASRNSITANHRWAVSSDCRPMALKTNPVAQAIREVALLFREKVVSLQAVMGADGWVFFCGSEPETHDRAASYAETRAQVQWPHPLDGLLASIDAPLDRNLYQLQKGFENHLAAVREGGWILLFSACRDGVGNDFFEPLASAYPHWQDLPDWDDQEYSLGLHKLYRTARARERCRLLLHSTLADDVVGRFYMEPVHHPERWVQDHLNASDRIGYVEAADACVSTVMVS